MILYLVFNDGYMAPIFVTSSRTSLCIVNDTNYNVGEKVLVYKPYFQKICQYGGVLDISAGQVSPMYKFVDSQNCLNPVAA